MRILFISTFFPYPPDNGSKIRAYYLLRALTNFHRVTLVAFQPTNNGNPDEQVLISKLGVQQVYPVPADPFHYVSIPQVLKYSSPIPVAFWPCGIMKHKVDEVVNSGQWDAVVAVQSFVARYALQPSGVPHILDIDTSLSYQMYERHIINHAQSLNRLLTWVSWQKARRYETRMFRRFKLCTVVSSREVDHIKAMIGPSACYVEVIPNGVDCRYNHPGLAQPRPRALIFNGALTYSANYDAMSFFLNEIYPLIQDQMPDVSLTITGSTSGVRLSRLPINKSVHLSGYVDDLRPLVAGAWVCVVPIRNGSGTRLKILEAMALGTPVVATSKGAEGLDLVDGEHILLANDPVTFVNHTLRLLSDPTLRQRLVTNARHLVEERYDWERIGDRFVTLVESAKGDTLRQSS
jgi:glycosyltransferase involved in cell wall biosynthesis